MNLTGTRDTFMTKTVKSAARAYSHTVDALKSITM